LIEVLSLVILVIIITNTIYLTELNPFLIVPILFLSGSIVAILSRGLVTLLGFSSIKVREKISKENKS
jgi:hypothetical protein